MQNAPFRIPAHRMGSGWVLQKFTDWHASCLRTWIPAPSLLVKKLRPRVGKGRSPGAAPKFISGSSRPNTPDSRGPIPGSASNWLCNLGQVA